MVMLLESLQGGEQSGILQRIRGSWLTHYGQQCLVLCVIHRENAAMVGNVGNQL
jgi:hypothetical protein